MKPTAFSFAEYEALQAAYEKQKEINKEWVDDYKKLLAENAVLEADLAVAVEDMNHIAKQIVNCNQFLSGGKDRVNSLKLGRCDVCKGICHEDKPCKFEWRGRKEQM